MSGVDTPSQAASRNFSAGPLGLAEFSRPYTTPCCGRKGEKSGGVPSDLGMRGNGVPIFSTTTQVPDPAEIRAAGGVATDDSGSRKDPVSDTLSPSDEGPSARRSRALAANGMDAERLPGGQSEGFAGGKGAHSACREGQQDVPQSPQSGILLSALLSEQIGLSPHPTPSAKAWVAGNED